MKKSVILSLLLSATLSQTVKAGTIYALGQVGGFNAYHSGGNAIFTGRVGLGVNRDFAINFRVNQEDHLFFCIYYGLELAYQGYQKKTDGGTISAGSMNYTWDASYQRHTIDLLGAIEYYPLSQWEVFLKFGPALVFQKSVYNHVSSSETFQQNQTICQGVPKLIFGLGYDLTHRLNISLNFVNEFEAGDAENARSLMAGLRLNIV